MNDIPFVMFILVASIFIYVYWQSNKLLEIEKGRKPIYKARCVSYLDGARHVFTRFSIYDDFIIVSSRKKIVLNFGEIKNMAQGKVLWAKSLDIVPIETNGPSISLLLKNIDTPWQIINSKLNKNV